MVSLSTAHLLLLFAVLLCASAGPAPPAVTQLHVLRVTKQDQNLTEGENKVLGQPPNQQSLVRRQITTTEASTCGYYGAEKSNSRTADPGYVCRFDVANGIWGFCPTSVIAASDCGLAGACIDRSSCETTCGKLGQGLTTVSCTEEGSFCSTVIVDAGVDQTYSYIACGAAATEETLFAYATAENPPTTLTNTVDDTTTSVPRATPSTGPQTPSEISTANPANTSSIPSPGDDQPDHSAAESQSSSSNVSTGAVIGAVLGGVALLCATAVVIVYIWRGKRRQQRQNNESDHQPNDMGGAALYYPEISKDSQWAHPAELDAIASSRRIEELPG